MTGHTSIIMLITVLLITVGGIAVVYEITQASGDEPSQVNRQEDDKNPELAFVNIIGSNITNETYKYVRVQVEYAGDEPLKLNDTYIQVRTSSSVADLSYRNGTATRSEIDGFYTE